MKQILYCPLLIIGPEALEDAEAFLGDLSGHSMLLAVYSIQPRLHYNLADHLVGLQWEQELLDPFSCSTPPRPLQGLDFGPLVVGLGALARSSRQHLEAMSSGSSSRL